MSDDMANNGNGNGSRGHNIAALNQKVLGLEADVQALGQNIAGLRQDFNAALERLGNKIDNRDDRKWMLAPAIGFLMFILSLMGGLGTMALLPLRGEMETMRGYIKEAKDDRLRAITELSDRDRRLWEHQLKMRSEFDFMRGQLNAKP